MNLRETQKKIFLFIDKNALPLFLLFCIIIAGSIGYSNGNHIGFNQGVAFGDCIYNDEDCTPEKFDTIYYPKHDNAIHMYPIKIRV